MDWKRSGLCTEVQIVSTYANEVQLPASISIDQVQSVSLLDTVVDDHLVPQRVITPPPEEIDGEEGYQVLSVDDS